MNLSDPTERHFTNALQASTATSFSELYEAYSPALYGVLLRLVHDSARAEDLLQETFIKIWLNRQYFDPQQGRLFTWMITITRHVALSELRSQKVRRAGQSYHYDRLEQSVRPSLLAGKLDQSLISQLPPKYQAVVELMYYQDYTSQEIADRLKLPLGTVKTRIRKAMQALRWQFRNDIYHYQTT
ncbi:RNA polymerase sigma factor [Spirosoma sp.]|uniref:RNA polymerase sigma factor n=1 Tax=Spirosoma sp. TaxID=1899569 RepID=UPI0026133C5D|nr:RNA polymerase sigma factor [Spirosoma sp.]MCX6212950.1 RNA polymerase sigma factor [Spirosoma sp.]